MALSEIVQVSISSGTANPVRRGFGQILHLAFTSVLDPAEVRRYASMAAVLEDFTSDSEVGKAALAFFSQSPRPRYFKVAGITAPGTDQTWTVDCTGLGSGDAPFAGQVTLENGVTAVWSVAWNTSLSQTMTDVATAITALTGVTGTSTATSYSLLVDTNGMVGYVEASPGLLKEVTADWDYDDALDDILDIDSDFYCVTASSNSPKNIDKIARWALANERFCLFAPQYTDPAAFASGEFTSGADFTALLANDKAAGVITQNPRSAHEEIAWGASQLAFDPGSRTWALKSVRGVGTDTWSATERGVIETAHANHYTTEAGIDIFRPGKTFGGEWIDVTIGLDWLVSRIQERIFGVLASAPKVPYTDAGAQILANEVRGQLKEAEDRLVLSPGESTVSVGLVEDEDPGDRSDRIYRGIEFTARLAGAVHEVLIFGTVTE